LSPTATAPSAEQSSRAFDIEERDRLGRPELKATPRTPDLLH
jgi:hypothetical protein